MDSPTQKNIRPKMDDSCRQYTTPHRSYSKRLDKYKGKSRSKIAFSRLEHISRDERVVVTGVKQRGRYDTAKKLQNINLNTQGERNSYRQV